MSPTSVGAADEKRIKETEGSEWLAALAVHRRKRGSRGRPAVFSGRESPRSVSGLVGPDGLAERLGRNKRFASVGGLTAAGVIGLASYVLSARATLVGAKQVHIPSLFSPPHPIHDPPLLRLAH